MIHLDLVEKIFILLGAPLLSSFNGTGNELLDAVDSEVYWKIAGIERTAESLIPLAEETKSEIEEETIRAMIRDLGAPEFLSRQRAMAGLEKAGTAAKPMLEEVIKSEDPEVAVSARSVLAKLNQKAGDVRLRQLLAIRALGEIRAESAVPHLENLTKSKELFVPEYAHRALARIRGEDWTPEPAPPGTLKEDLAILCPSSQVLVHTRIIRGPTGFSMRAALHEANEIWDDLGKRGFKFPGILETDTVLDRMTRLAAPMLDRMGNIRIDSTTLAVPSDIKAEQEGFVVAARGLWDGWRVAEDFKRMFGGVEVEIGGIKWIRDEHSHQWIHLPSNDLAVYVAGDGMKPYVEAISARLAGEDKSPAEGAAVELAKGAPEEAPFIAAIVPSEFFHDRMPVVDSVESFLAWHLPAGETGFSFHSIVQGKNEKQLDDILQQSRLLIAMGKGVLEAFAQTDKRLAPFPAMLDSIKMKLDGMKLTTRAELPRMLDSHLGMIVGMVSSALAR